MGNVLTLRQAPAPDHAIHQQMEML